VVGRRRTTSARARVVGATERERTRGRRVLRGRRWVAAWRGRGRVRPRRGAAVGVLTRSGSDLRTRRRLPTQRPSLRRPRRPCASSLLACSGTLSLAPESPRWSGSTRTLSAPCRPAWTPSRGRTRALEALVTLVVGHRLWAPGVGARPAPLGPARALRALSSCPLSLAPASARLRHARLAVRRPEVGARVARLRPVLPAALCRGRPRLRPLCQLLSLPASSCDRDCALVND
jgi:hypothetical protein